MFPLLRSSGELRHTEITVLWNQGEPPHPSTHHSWAQLLLGTKPSCPSPPSTHSSSSQGHYWGKLGEKN